MDERGQVDAAVLVFPELHADAVVGNGADDDVVVVGGLPTGVVAVQQDELGPLLAVVVEAECFQPSHCCVVGLEGDDSGYACFQLLHFDLGHIHCLGVLAAEVEALAEVLVRLRLGEVDVTEIGVSAVIENHTRAPPFLWQYSAMSLTIDWNDCVWQ